MACADALTLAEMEDRVFGMLGEDPDNPVYWSAAEVQRYINDAYRQAARDTAALEYIEAIALTSGSEAGSLSDYVGRVLRVTWEDQKIENLTKWELDRMDNDWENLTGTVTHYVTTQQDNRTISTFRAWDGGENYSEEHFYSDGAHTYAAWANATAYVIGNRVTITTSNIERGYYCIADHTSDTTNDKPSSGTNWTTYWTPLALTVWATKVPAVLTTNDEAEFPQWCHLGICYSAAARALRKYGEQRNPMLAGAYDMLALEYGRLLKAHVANRTPEKLVQRGETWPRRPRPISEQTVA